MTEFVKEEIRKSVPIFVSLRLWIQLRIPRLEDGNNFGVSIQKDCIKRIVDAEDQMEYTLDLITKYYKLRGEAALKVFYQFHLISSNHIISYQIILYYIKSHQSIQFYI